MSSEIKVASEDVELVNKIIQRWYAEGSPLGDEFDRLNWARYEAAKEICDILEIELKTTAQ